MKAKFLVVGAMTAGITVFVWGGISHMLLPIGEVGIREIPNEVAVVGSMRETIREPGFYFFPGMGVPHRQADQATQRAWEEKYRRGPRGILIYQPQGTEPMSLGQLGTELLSNILAALVAAFLLAQAASGLANYAGRAVFVALLGLFTSLDIHASYWNWYGFPTNYTLAATADAVIGWALAGLVLAALSKKMVPAS